MALARPNRHRATAIAGSSARFKNTRSQQSLNSPGRWSFRDRRRMPRIDCARTTRPPTRVPRDKILDGLPLRRSAAERSDRLHDRFKGAPGAVLASYPYIIVVHEELSTAGFPLLEIPCICLAHARISVGGHVEIIKGICRSVREILSTLVRQYRELVRGENRDEVLQPCCILGDKPTRRDRAVVLRKQGSK